MKTGKDVVQDYVNMLMRHATAQARAQEPDSNYTNQDPDLKPENLTIYDKCPKPFGRPPYPEFCRHPDKCAGLGSCPRDPTCAD